MTIIQMVTVRVNFAGISLLICEVCHRRPPRGIYEAAGGGVTAAKVPARARDDAASRRLWDIAEQLTSTSYPEPN
jgi:hypothetical protein